MKFERITKTSIAEGIIEQIKSMIIDNTLKPGAQLPSEEKLAEQMGVGRGTIREALKVLIYAGFLIRKNKGTFVTSMPIASLPVKAFFARFRAHRDVMEMIEVRKLIEPQASALAAERANEEALLKIKDALQEMVESQVDLEKFITKDIQFHNTIIEATGNKVLLELMMHIRGTMKKNQALVLRRSHIMPRSLEFHKKITAAISGRDQEKARQLMFEHVIDIEKEMQKILQEENS